MNLVNHSTNIFLDLNNLWRKQIDRSVRMLHVKVLEMIKRPLISSDP